MIGYAYVTLLTLLTVLSVRTLVVLGPAAPWTSLGWALTIAYDGAASYEIAAKSHLPMHVPYWFLGALVVAFVVAGIRDEPQADPWWWPRAIGLTRAQRRALR